MVILRIIDHLNTFAEEDAVSMGGGEDLEEHHMELKNLMVQIKPSFPKRPKPIRRSESFGSTEKPLKPKRSPSSAFTEQTNGVKLFLSTVSSWFRLTNQPPGGPRPLMTANKSAFVWTYRRSDGAKPTESGTAD